MERARLLPTFCRRCGRHLADLPASAWTNCPCCGLWTKAGSLAPKPANGDCLSDRRKGGTGHAATAAV